MLHQSHVVYCRFLSCACIYNQSNLHKRWENNTLQNGAWEQSSIDEVWMIIALKSIMIHWGPGEKAVVVVVPCRANHVITDEQPIWWLVDTIYQTFAAYYTNSYCIKWTVIIAEGIYSISQEIWTRFCCALLCFGHAIVHNEFTWSIYPYSSGLLCWHWGNR